MQLSSHRKPPFLTTVPGRLALGACVGFAVAVYVTMSLQMETKYTFAALVGVLAACIAILSGDVKRFFTGILLLSFPFILFQKIVSFTTGPHICVGIGVSILDLSLTALMTLYVLRRWFYREEGTAATPFTALHSAIYFYLAASLLAIFPATDRMLSTYEIVKLGKGLVIFFWVSHSIRSSREHRYVAAFIILGAIIQSTVVILQSFEIIPMALANLTREDRGSTEFYFHDKLYFRPGGTMAHANLLSLFLGMSIPFAFSLLLLPDLNRWFRRYCWIAFLAGVLALLVCFSRAGWLNVTLSTVTILVFHYRKPESRKRVIQTITLFSLAVVAALFKYWTALVDRIFHSDPNLLTDRWGTFRDSLRIWADHPILGVGLNNYYHRLSDYMVDGIPFPVHNLFLLHLADMGAVGLAAFLVLIVAFLRTAARLAKERDPFRSAIAIALFGIMLGIMGDGIFNFAWKMDTIYLLFWAEAGWLVALDRSREADRVHEPRYGG